MNFWVVYFIKKCTLCKGGWWWWKNWINHQKCFCAYIYIYIYIKSWGECGMHQVVYVEIYVHSKQYVCL